MTNTQREWTAAEQAEHRTLWVEALRSGKYEQARGGLRDEQGRMCCLGVACDVSGLGAWDGLSYVIGHHRDTDNLLPQVAAWLGLKGFGGAYGDSALWEQNDDHRASFKKIADIIESEPPGLIAKTEV